MQNNCKDKFNYIYLILLFSFISFMFLNFQMQFLDWDALAYIMNGRTLIGSENYFEWHRPILFPLVIALTGGVEILARLIGVLLSFLAVYGIYLLGKEAFDENTGLFSAGLFSLTPIITNWAPRLYTEIPLIGKKGVLIT